MDLVPYSAKRIHWSYSTHANRQVRKWKLTAGRIDLLVTHRISRLHHGTVYQSALQARLGVTRATICIMLQRMERHGLITRERSREDRRKNIVNVTPLGYAALEKARHLVDGGFYRDVVDYSLLLLDLKTPVRTTRARFLSCLGDMRRTFGDLLHAPYPEEPSPNILALCRHEKAGDSHGAQPAPS